MDYSQKNKFQLLEDVKHFKQRGRDLELTLKVVQEECIRRRDLLETSYDKLQSVIDNIGDPILVIDRNYRVVLVNKKTREVSGKTDPVQEGLFCYQISHHRNVPCKGKNVPCPLRKILREKNTITVTHTHYDSSGNKMFVEIIASPILDKKGRITHIIESCRDITERRTMEQALRESENRYRSLFEQSGDAIFVLSAEGPDAGKILSANNSACLMHGYTEEEIHRLYITDLDTPEYASRAPELIKQVLAGKIMRFEVIHRKKDGTIFPVEVCASVMEAGGKKLILAIDRDISKRRHAERERSKLIKKLEHTSQTDGLTGLLNRQHLDIRLREEVRRAKRYDNPLSIVMFDIDRFKEINDSYGHIIGDRILKNIADIVRETLRDTDIAGRFGGDEFILILVQTPIAVGVQVAERIRDKIEQAKISVKKDKFINFTISIGICQHNNKLKNIEEFVAKADKAVYKAKDSGQNKICVAKI
jgi:diguanylate cyclase (GGDEF)-like protein/PAS domain S-box-containing protein